MRLRLLDLQRYGHLSDAMISFPSQAALCVVYGANEAGKSTALSAIADALFGIPERSKHAFLHPAPQLRVGITLAAHDGRQATFVRRKGRGGTLLNDAGESVPESAIQRFLGGIGRDAFEATFGLNGERLRAGGTALAQLGGGVGETLFAAGTGLAGLRTALEKIDAEAKTLFGDGRGKRRIAEATDAYDRARHLAVDLQVKPRDWQETDRAYREAVEKLASLRSDAARLDAEANRLHRVRCVAPILAQLDRVRAVQAELADAPVLPADADAELRRFLTARSEAKRDAEREAAEAARLIRERDALPRGPAILDAQDAIDDLAARRPVAMQAAADLPQRRLEMAESRSAVADAATELGLPAEVARDSVPPRNVRVAVQQLLTEHAKIADRIAKSARALAQGEAKHARAEVALRALPPPRDPTLLRATITAARSQGPLDDEIARREQQVSQARASCAAALAALPLWTGDADALAASPVPLPAATVTAGLRLTESEDAQIKARDDLANLDADAAECDERIALLARGETVPTPAAVATAREARDRAWRFVRRNLDGGPSPTAEELAALPPVPMADAFEALRDEADRLADRRADDAQRVADYLTAEARRASIRTRRAETAARFTAAKREHADAQAAWRALWAPAGILPETPAAMAEWRRARIDVLKLADAVGEAEGLRDEVARKRADACETLRAVLPDAPPHSSLGALLTRADAACAAAEAARDAYGEAEKTLAREASTIADLREELRAAEDALAAWGATWATAAATLALPADCPPDRAKAALEAWQRIAERAETWRSDERRIAQMSDTVAAFEAAVRATLGAIGAAPTDEPPFACAARLIRELAQTRKAEADAVALADRIDTHARNARDAAERARAAETELCGLRALAGASDDAALEAAIVRSRHREAADAEAERCLGELATQGDGRDEAALRSEAAAADMDEVTARLAAIADERAACDAERERLTAERTRTEAALAEMQKGRDAAQAAQEARHALADAVAAAERYARLHVARTLFHSGIDRFRREQQGPLLRAAGAHFAALTSGRYVGLIADEDGGKAVIQAVRDDRTECPLDALSEGTRDQLYLALRAAIVEAHAATAEPLPFIADDLLVHFDNARAAAAIRLLAKLGRTTQVILFTHHEHVAALAAAGHSPDISVLRFHETPAAVQARMAAA